jgi:hypothetical protein
MFEVKKNKHVNVLKEVKCLCIGFVSTTGMMKCPVIEERKMILSLCR